MLFCIELKKCTLYIGINKIVFWKYCIFRSNNIYWKIIKQKHWVNRVSLLFNTFCSFAGRIFGVSSASDHSKECLWGEKWLHFYLHDPLDATTTDPLTGDWERFRVWMSAPINRLLTFQFIYCKVLLPFQKT